MTAALLSARQKKKGGFSDYFFFPQNPYPLGHFATRKPHLTSVASKVSSAIFPPPLWQSYPQLQNQTVSAQTQPGPKQQLGFARSDCTPCCRLCFGPKKKQAQGCLFSGDAKVLWSR